MKWNFISGDYELLIQSSEIGQPSGKSNFSTYYESDTFIRDDYQFYYNIGIDVNFFNSFVNNEYENYSSMEDIKLFSKNFKYDIISDDEIILVYKYDNNFYITINLKDYSECYDLEGNFIYDKEGNIKMLENYDFLEFIKKDKDFNNVLNIKIDKK